MSALHTALVNFPVVPPVRKSVVRRAHRTPRGVMTEIDIFNAQMRGLGYYGSYGGGDTGSFNYIAPPTPATDSSGSGVDLTPPDIQGSTSGTIFDPFSNVSQDISSWLLPPADSLNPPSVNSAIANDEFPYGLPGVQPGPPKAGGILSSIGNAISNFAKNLTASAGPGSGPVTINAPGTPKNPYVPPTMATPASGLGASTIIPGIPDWMIWVGGGLAAVMVLKSVSK